MGINKKNKQGYYEAINMILQTYNMAGFTVTKIHCNNEYKAILYNIMDDLDIELHYVNTQEHKSVAERNIRMIKERMRTMYHYLPYKYLPRLITEYMCYEAVTKLDIFPAKYRVLTYYSPYVIMNQKLLDYN